VLDVENVNINITAPDEEEDSTPSFGGNPPAQKKD